MVLFLPGWNFSPVYLNETLAWRNSEIHGKIKFGSARVKSFPQKLLVFHTFFSHKFPSCAISVRNKARAEIAHVIEQIFWPVNRAEFQLGLKFYHVITL